MTLKMSDIDRRPVILIGLAVACSLLGDMTIYAVVPVYHGALGLQPLEVGILLSANRWVRLVTNHLAHRVVTARRASVVLALVLLAGAAATLVYAAAPPFWLFLAGRIIWGVCWSFIRHIGVMTSLGAAGEEHAAGILGIYNGVVQLGFIVGTLAGAALFDAFGYSTAFLVVGIVSLAGIPIDYAGFRLLPASPKSHETRTSHAATTDRAILLRGFIVSCVSTGLIISTLGFALRERFGDTLHLGSLAIGITTLNGALIAAHYAINSIGSPPIGAAIDRIGRRSAEIAAFAIGWAALVAAASFAALPLLVPAVIVFFIATVACKLSLVSQAGIVGSASFSRLMTASDLGAATGPLAGWYAIERVGSPDVVFAIGGVLYAIATLSALIRFYSGRRYG